MGTHRRGTFRTLAQATLLLRERYFSPMAEGAYAVLGDDLREQLVRVEPSTDGHCSYRPCRVTLRTGEIRDLVYVVEAESYFAMWGVWPEADSAKRSLPIEEVSAIDESPLRLPAALANKVYAAGESGMGYYTFTVVLRDGTKLPYTTGDAVDFPLLPSGVTTDDVADVLPGYGGGRFHDRAPRPDESDADYWWCLYRE
jgi:hypothetical protein